MTLADRPFVFANLRATSGGWQASQLRLAGQ